MKKPLVLTTIYLAIITVSATVCWILSALPYVGTAWYFFGDLFLCVCAWGSIAAVKEVRWQATYIEAEQESIDAIPEAQRAVFARGRNGQYRRIYPS